MLIEVFAAASIGGVVGFFTCAALTAGKINEIQGQVAHTYHEALTLCRQIYVIHYREQAPDWKPIDSLNGIMSQLDNMIAGLSIKLTEANRAHSRASDAAGAMQARIERALDCVTENSAHVGKKMAAILKGERL